MLGWLRNWLGSKTETRYLYGDRAYLHDLGPSGGQSEAGEIVNTNTALIYSPVWQAVTMISGDCAKLKLCRYRQREDYREPVRGPFDAMLNRAPNEELDAYKLWRRFYVHLLLWGNAYIYLDKEQSGAIRGLYNLLPDRTFPVRHNGRLQFNTEVDGVLITLENDQVFHVEGINVDGFAGVHLVNAARDSWGLALAAENFASRFYSSGTQAGGILELPASMSPKAANNLEEGWRQKYTSKQNWFKTVVLRDGAKFHAVTVDAQKSQQHELREDQVREVARRYNLAPSRLGLSDSVSYNSKTEDNQDYLDTTLSPILESVERQADFKFLSEFQRSSGLFYEYDTKQLLRMNLLQRYQAYDIGIKNAWLSPDDVRFAENMAPRPDGQGDVYLAPMNMTTTEKIVEDEPEPAPAPAIPPPAEEVEENSLTLDVRRWMYALTTDGRLKARRPSKFVEWVDRGLHPHRDRLTRIAGTDAAADELLTELRGLLERVEPSQLVAEADAVFREFEKRETQIVEQIRCVLN